MFLCLRGRAFFQTLLLLKFYWNNDKKVEHADIHTIALNGVVLVKKR